MHTHHQLIGAPRVLARLAKRPTHWHARRGRLAAQAACGVALCWLSVSSQGAAQQLTLGIGRTQSSGPPDPDAAEHSDQQLSLGGSFTHSGSQGANDQAGSLLVGQFGNLNSTRLGWIQRARSFAMLGGGSAELEGGIGADVGAGPLFEITPGQGSFARGGFSAELFGNAQFYSSWITLPRLEVGYHSHNSVRLLEGSAFIAPAWTGRVKLSDQGGSHDLGRSIEHGFLASVNTDRARFDVMFQRFAWWNVAHATTIVRVTACGRFGRPSVCFRARLYEAPQDQPQLEHARVGYFGVFVGLGPLVAAP